MIYLAFKKNFVGAGTMAGISINEVAAFDNPSQLVAFMADLSYKTVTTYENNQYKADNFIVLFADFCDDSAIKPEHVPPFDSVEFYAFYTSPTMPSDIVDKFARQYLRNRGKHGSLDSVNNVNNQQIYFYKIA